MVKLSTNYDSILRLELAQKYYAQLFDGSCFWLDKPKKRAAKEGGGETGVHVRTKLRGTLVCA